MEASRTRRLSGVALKEEAPELPGRQTGNAP
jgi:hypothetical protein